MRSRSPSIMSASSLDDDIEMANLNDLDAGSPNGAKLYDPQDDDSDDGLDQGGQEDVALLRSPQRTRTRERIHVHSLQGWQQVKGIVIEVRVYTLIDMCHI